MGWMCCRAAAILFVLTSHATFFLLFKLFQSLIGQADQLFLWVLGSGAFFLSGF